MIYMTVATMYSHYEKYNFVITISYMCNIKSIIINNEQKILVL